MQLDRVLPLAAIACLFALTLHGCDFGEPEEVPEQPLQSPGSSPPQRVSKPKPVRKTAAKCNGGHFQCDGGWKEWCSRMKKQCTKKDCAPMCAWTCDSPKCNQECGPVCNQPACSTRCKGFNTDSCKMQCGKPNCKVVCPKHFCPSEDCAACKTECAKPHCAMICGKDEQPCRHVCAQPVCKWECKDPGACPKPKCAMKCKSMDHCEGSPMHMFSKIPPMEPGETEIVTASDGPSPAPSPALLMQSKASSMRVNFTRMGDDHTVHTGQVDLAMVQFSATESDMDSWAREVSEYEGGHVVESEASCAKGGFKCQGEASWCAAQEKELCVTGQSRSSRLRADGQGHLQA